MAYIFGDGFDVYATPSDPTAGYWDSGLPLGNGNTLVAGRFTGSNAYQINTGNVSPFLVKSSAVNDAVHHFVVSFRQTAALSGTGVGLYLQLLDGTTGQCCILFRSDGVILLTSATPAGTVLATYTGAVSAVNTWFAFEFEVVIHPTAGSFTVRKNGNPANDFTATSLNTRPGANSYANKLQIGQVNSVSSVQFDDILWRSDTSSVPWVGDIRCYTRMPASDASVQFTKSFTSISTGSFGSNGTVSDNSNTSYYTLFTANYTGTISRIDAGFNPGFTGNAKMSLFASTASLPGAVLGSATTLANPVTGLNTFTFPTPVPVTRGTQYWFGVITDVTALVATFNPSTGSGRQSTTASYASFPVATPLTGASINGQNCNVFVNPGLNSEFVNEAQQDGTTSYVYDSTIGHADFYNIQALVGTPASVIALITRGFIEKSDAGFRSGAVQLKSGGATVASPTANLSTSWGWVWRVDQTDPNTSAAWTPVAVNGAQIGPVVIG